MGTAVARALRHAPAIHLSEGTLFLVISLMAMRSWQGAADIMRGIVGRLLCGWTSRLARYDFSSATGVRKTVSPTYPELEPVFVPQKSYGIVSQQHRYSIYNR